MNKILNELKTIAPSLSATVVALIDGSGGIWTAGLISTLSALHSQRAIELLQRSFENLNISKLDKEFLNSEAFLEVFERSIEIVTKTASDKKRKLVADYLSGVIQSATINDIHGQLLEDLNTLQEFHLQVIAMLPNTVDSVAKYPSVEEVNNMKLYIYEKAISDLIKLGFLKDSNIFPDDRGCSKLTTEYLVKFKETFRNLNE